MYVRCFTKTSEWEEWLAVKERLAIGIKKLLKKIKPLLLSPSQSIYVEKNDCSFLFGITGFKTLHICCNC